jgi:hypothetical protein
MFEAYRKVTLTVPVADSQMKILVPSVETPIPPFETSKFVN